MTPICPHFGVCGGCRYQDRPADEYAAIKRTHIIEALEKADLPTCAVAPLLPCPPAARRRVTFTARRTKKTVQIGFNRRASHDLIAVDTCPILVPSLQNLIPALPQIARPFLSRRATARIALTSTDTGIACSVSGDAKLPDATAIETLARDAEERGICEIAFADEVLTTLEPPMIDLAGTSVRLPPQSFLQATEHAERTMQAAVSETIHERSARRIIDFFSGVGTLTFAAAKHAAVTAYEIDQSSLDALTAARDRTTGLKVIDAHQRNLMKNPLPAAAIAEADCVIIDPPRAGALAQTREIAAASPATIIAISCNPVTMARDLAVLTASGYQLERVQPIDQFVYTDHVEVLAVLTR